MAAEEAMFSGVCAYVLFEFSEHLNALNILTFSKHFQIFVFDFLETSTVESA